jgi:DeoR/GlpR family transcriptional regulator of sugar metabolism
MLRTNPGLSVPSYADLLGVSQGTIRNDLDALSKENRVIRVRGGAILADQENEQSQNLSSRAFAGRMRNNHLKKLAIAVQAAKLVADGDAILLDASTTVYYVAKFLSERTNLRIVTNCLETARLLSQNPTHNVMLVGGILRAGSESVIGPWAENFLDGLCTRFAFISCSGFTPEVGMAEVDLFESQFRLKAIQCAEETIALVDSTKFGKVDLTPSLQPDQIKKLYTDDMLEETWKKRLISNGYTYELCPIKTS